MALPQAETRSPGRVLGPRAEKTKALVLDTARAMFLEKGYGGTRIDDIADAAEISRGSFYTYFPSKRDVLLAAGAESAREADQVVANLAAIPEKWAMKHLREWVRQWLGFLDNHGAFVLVWGQAAHDDDEMRKSGVRTQMRLAKKVGETLVRLGHRQPIHAASDALALIGMMERLWYYHYVANGMIDHEEILDSITRIMGACITGTSRS